MEMRTDKKSYIIYLSYEDKEKENEIKKLINDKLQNIEVKTFTFKKELIDIEEADLIITDLCYDKNKVNKVFGILKRLNEKNTVPYLFIIENDILDEDLLKSTFFKSSLVFDFIHLEHLPSYMINRIRVLLNIPRIIKNDMVERDRIQENIWNLLNYTNIFVVVLDQCQKIKLINYHLSHCLGYESSEELIDTNWSNFIRPAESELIKHVCFEIMHGSDLYKEYTSDIIDKNGKSITVKWFNSFINHEFNHVFSIGISLTKEPSINDDIDSIRMYFNDILQKDRTTITAMKEVATKYSKKIFSERETI